MAPPTDRQVAVLRAVVESGGRRHRAAVALGLSDKTVQAHLQQLYVRLAVGNIIEAMQVLGWVRLPTERR